MKKLLINLFSLLLASYSFSQFKQVEKENLIGKVQHFKITENESIYTCTYTDIKFKTMNEIKSFNLNKGEFDQLYEIIEKGLNEVPKESVEIENNDLRLSIEFVKMMGVRSIQITHYDKETGIIGLTSYLTKKQVSKVFGKD